eukprot:3162862-Amphidinium_carterae.1
MPRRCQSCAQKGLLVVESAMPETEGEEKLRPGDVLLTERRQHAKVTATDLGAPTFLDNNVRSMSYTSPRVPVPYCVTAQSGVL